MTPTIPVLSDHPIAPAIRLRVLEALDTIEREHDVRVLFACESLSRGWGGASPDSDYDVRFVYVPRLPLYLTVAPGRDVIELPISDEVDLSGWELRKALGLLHRSNPTVLVWIDSRGSTASTPGTAKRSMSWPPRSSTRYATGITTC